MDKTERALRDIDYQATRKTGTSIFHILTLLSIVASLALFFSGRRVEGIFVGLWPPTFQALKAASEKNAL